MDSFKKPFRAVPIQLGEEYRTRQRRENRRIWIGMAVRIAVIASLIFVTGMVLTNFPKVEGYLPIRRFGASADQSASRYFPNCSTARATGHAPIQAGSPGYRIGLDADGDGIACEPYIDP